MRGSCRGGLLRTGSKHRGASKPTVLVPQPVQPSVQPLPPLWWRWRLCNLWLLAGPLAGAAGVGGGQGSQWYGSGCKGTGFTPFSCFPQHPCQSSLCVRVAPVQRAVLGGVVVHVSKVFGPFVPRASSAHAAALAALAAAAPAARSGGGWGRRPRRPGSTAWRRELGQLRAAERSARQAELHNKRASVVWPPRAQRTSGGRVRSRRASQSCCGRGGRPPETCSAGAAQETLPSGLSIPRTNLPLPCCLQLPDVGQCDRATDKKFSIHSNVAHPSSVAGTGAAAAGAGAAPQPSKSCRPAAACWFDGAAAAWTPLLLCVAGAATVGGGDRMLAVSPGGGASGMRRRGAATAPLGAAAEPLPPRRARKLSPSAAACSFFFTVILRSRSGEG